MKDCLKSPKVSVKEDVLNNKIKEIQGQVHEVSETEESCKAETINKATIKYANKCLDEVEKVEVEFKKIKKNDNNLGFTLMTKA